MYWNGHGAGLAAYELGVASPAGRVVEQLIKLTGHSGQGRLMVSLVHHARHAGFQVPRLRCSIRTARILPGAACVRSTARRSATAGPLKFPTSAQQCGCQTVLTRMRQWPGETGIFWGDCSCATVLLSIVLGLLHGCWVD